MELVLIRHGLPLRVETQDGSPADPALSEVGHIQAKAMAEWLVTEDIGAVYASPMRRAHQTAEPLAQVLGMEICTDPRVAEFDQQDERYIPLEQLKAEDRTAWTELVSGTFERDLSEFRTNVTAGLADIASRHQGETVAVVCHGGVINAWGSHILERDDLFFIDVNYTSINRFLVSSRGHRSIKSLNEVPHLRSLSN